MKQSFLKDKNNILEFLGVLNGGKPKNEERELIEIDCTVAQIEKLCFGYDASLVDGILVLTSNQYAADLESVDYQEKRKAEYPDIGDQLDAYWKLLENPDNQEGLEMLARIKAVKQKYPKPTP